MKSADDFLDKTKEFAEKAESKITEEYAKLKESEAYAKIAGLLDSAGSYTGQKMEEFKNGEYKEKIDDLREQAETVVDHIRAVGTILAGDLDETIDSVKDKLSGGNKKSETDSKP